VGADSLRIGCVQYLNARPLIHGWPGKVIFDHPSALCASLAAGELDVALVSSFEFLRNPIYRIVDDVSISSHGPVYSVVVAHREEISQVDEIALDPASETSVNLLRCLLAERGLNPRLVEGGAGPSVARLLIGDQAIRFRQQHETEVFEHSQLMNRSRRRPRPRSREGRKIEDDDENENEFGKTDSSSTLPHQTHPQFLDLGEWWRDATGLPFVYALWLIRPNIEHASEIAARLRALRDKNLGGLDELISVEKEFSPDFCAHYFRQSLCFEFGQPEKEGLLSFGELCQKHGVLPAQPIELGLV
jgi:predicted solute-binding protein